MASSEARLVGRLGFRIRNGKLINYNDEGQVVAVRPADPAAQVLWEELLRQPEQEETK